MNGNDNQFSVNTRDIQAGKWIIKILVYLIYLAAAGFATFAFYSEVDNLFKDASPLLAFFATVGAWANFGSVAVMPWAKDHWITGRGMMVVAVIGWALEVLMMGMNTLAAYGSTWATGWAQLSFATPIFVIGLWGLLWMLHPDHKQRQMIMAFHNQAQADYLDKLSRAMQSQAVQDTLTEAAIKNAQQFAEQALNVRINGTYTGDMDGRGKRDATQDQGNRRTRPIFYHPRIKEGEANFPHPGQNGRKS